MKILPKRICTLEELEAADTTAIGNMQLISWEDVYKRQGIILSIICLVLLCVLLYENGPYMICLLYTSIVGNIYEKSIYVLN